MLMLSVYYTRKIGVCPMLGHGISFYIPLSGSIILKGFFLIASLHQWYAVRSCILSYLFRYLKSLFCFSVVTCMLFKLLFIFANAILLSIKEVSNYIS